MQIALAQVNPCVGDLTGNATKMLMAQAAAQSEGADLVIFGAHSLTGAPLGGLVTDSAFMTQAHLQAQAFAAVADLPCIFSCYATLIDEQTGQEELAPILYATSKERLVYLGTPQELEDGECLIAELGGLTFAFLLDECFKADCDLSGVDVAVEVRAACTYDDCVLELAQGDFSRPQAIAETNGCYLVSANIVGGQDNLIFPGGSFVFGSGGFLLHSFEIDEEEIFIFDTQLSAADSSEDNSLSCLDHEVIVWRLLRLALADYVHKNHFDDVVIGLSGGVDSSVVAALAADALGAQHVHGLILPGPFTSDDSINDARELAENLGIRTETISILTAYNATRAGCPALFNGPEGELARENLQARIRTNYLMAYSNRNRALMLNTGNKSESAMGFSTLYGDSGGAFAPIGDIYKQEVFALAQYRHNAGISIPQSVIDKEPSAELYEDAKDSDRLPPYALLDALLYDHIELDATASELVASGYDADMVTRVINTVRINEFKRRQEPLAPHVFGRSLVYDRIRPLTNGWIDRP